MPPCIVYAEEARCRPDDDEPAPPSRMWSAPPPLFASRRRVVSTRSLVPTTSRSFFGDRARLSTGASYFRPCVTANCFGVVKEERKEERAVRRGAQNNQRRHNSFRHNKIEEHRDRGSDRQGARRLQGRRIRVQELTVCAL